MQREKFQKLRDDLDKKVLDLLGNHQGGITVAQLRNQTNVCYSRVVESLQRLQERGWARVVRKEGPLNYWGVCLHA